MEISDDLRFDQGDETPERLKRQFSRLAGMTAAQARRIAADAFGAVGAHKDHYVALAVLAELGPASQAVLARRARIYKSDLVAVINALAEGGWVRRAPDPADKRRNVITVTALGEERLAELDAILADVNERILAPLDAGERRDLFRLLGRVNAHLAGGG
jgi:DNA-binding MarR family transcriptional regulator